MAAGSAFAEAVRNDDPEVFVAFIREQDAKKRARDMEMLEFQRRVEANPFDTEAQAKIEEIIRENNVNANWEAAMENNPEVSNPEVSNPEVDNPSHSRRGCYREVSSPVAVAQT